jgi:hypothetical protein
MVAIFVGVTAQKSDIINIDEWICHSNFESNNIANEIIEQLELEEGSNLPFKDKVCFHCEKKCISIWIIYEIWISIVQFTA